MGRAVLQYSPCTCDTALGWGRRARRWARGTRAAGAGARGAQAARELGEACARRLGQVGVLCTWLSSDSVFDPVLTQYCY